MTKNNALFLFSAIACTVAVGLAVMRGLGHIGPDTTLGELFKSLLDSWSRLSDSLR